MEEITRPLPIPDQESRFYWESAKQSKLSIVRCQQCGFYIHYPRDHCPECHSRNVKPEEVSGRGKIYSYTQVHRPLSPGFKAPLPYLLALVELEEQPSVRILTNLMGTSYDELDIGMSVEVVFEELADNIGIPLFRPMKGNP